MGAPIKIGYIDDWPGRMMSRLYEQFKGKPKIEYLAAVILGQQFQDLEDAAQTLLTLFDIDNSEGAQLDILGRIVGQPRGGLDDATYRIYLRARIAANNSSGGPEEIYAVFNALYGLPMIFVQGGLKSFVLRVNGPITPAQAAVGPPFLRDAKESGARGVFEWQELVSDLMFTNALAGCTPAALAPGATTIDVGYAVASRFPPSGTVVVDPGLAVEETIAYSSIIDGVLQTAALANPHAVGAAVEVQAIPVGWPVALGRGWGDFFNPAVGGAYEGAAQAPEA